MIGRKVEDSLGPKMLEAGGQNCSPCLEATAFYGKSCFPSGSLSRGGRKEQQTSTKMISLPFPFKFKYVTLLLLLLFYYFAMYSGH